MRVDQMLPNIEIKSKELIKPSSPTPHDIKDLKLSFLDQLAGSSYMPLISFYQNQSCSNNIDHSQRCQHLKRSLSEVLTRFYPLAGRINENFSSIHCNDSGALLIEAQVLANISKTVQNATIEDLKLYLPLDPYANGNKIPLAIQISFFECGGIAIGVCLSHKIADAICLVTFVNAWADACRGKAEGIVQPSFDLASRLFPPVEFSVPDYVPDTKKEAFVTKRFVFDKEKLLAIKQLVSSDKVKDPTRVEAVSAFLWKHFIGISQTNDKGDGTKSISTCTSAAIHAVNLRARMSLPFDGFTFGNLTVLAFAILRSEEARDYGDLSYCLRTSFREIDDDYIQNVQKGVPYLNTLRNADEILSKQETAGTCFFTSCCRFPMHEVDYGWGKPILVCLAGVRSKNAVVLMNTRCGDGIEACITMDEKEMAMLPDDLLSLATDKIWP